MSGNIFYRLDPLLICLVLMGVLIAAVEIGFWAKGRMKAWFRQHRKGRYCAHSRRSNDTAGSLAWVHLCDV